VARILCVNPSGKGDLHELRAQRLTAYLNADVTICSSPKSSSRRSAAKQFSDAIASTAWDLVYQESTGISAGLNLIRAALKKKQKYIVSSGDPISGFFRVTRGPAVAAPFAVYEKWLYALSAGFIGWTPYLTGRAIHLGAPRGATIEGSVDLDLFRPFPSSERTAIRARYGIPASHLVCGVVGSLRWSQRQRYCYGLELIETLTHLRRTDITMLIVGDGEGRAILERRIPDKLRSRVIFTGSIPAEKVPEAINAMDVGFITQTLDSLGNYRLTTKLPEYLGSGLPVAMSPIPGYFDYVGPAGWPLPSKHPASREFSELCANWLDDLSIDEVDSRRALARTIAEERFSYSVTGPRFKRFVEHVLDSS